MGPRSSGSLTISRWPSARLVAALPLLGCGPGKAGGDETFRVTALTADELTITLTFSEPVADVGQVDPNDFRISVAQTIELMYDYYGQTETWRWTGYQDAGYFDYSYEYEYGRLSFVSIERGARADQLVLTPDRQFLTDACTYVEYIQDQYSMFPDQYANSLRYDVGVFLHYAGRDVPVASEQGEPLADIGADWVLEDGSYIVRPDSYGFIQLIPQLRIPCP